LHTAILLEDQPGASEHVNALVAIEEPPSPTPPTIPPTRSPYVAALATAARCWVEVMRGEVDAVRVADAARELDSFGLSWDAARLAGQAAIRTTDRPAMTSLLDTARIIQGRQSGRPPGIDDDNRLSEREREVAELVLAGLTYKQIGDQLFISAKTVEHHVARMRQRLSCASRSELLARLRTLSLAVPRQRSG
jgi:DNA-binding CsgD family transcriptional regulator